MCDLDLLERIRCNEPDAFLELTERYGWAVYSVIRERYADHTIADKIYNETMNAFYHTLSNSNTEDPLEAILCGFAIQNLEKEAANQRIYAESAEAHMPPKIHLDVHNRPQETKKKNGFCYFIGTIFILVAIAAVFWCVAGLLMDLNYIPYYDLGYSWFNANIMPLF